MFVSFPFEVRRSTDCFISLYRLSDSGAKTQKKWDGGDWAQTARSLFRRRAVSRPSPLALFPLWLLFENLERTALD